MLDKNKRKFKLDALKDADLIYEMNKITERKTGIHFIISFLVEESGLLESIKNDWINKVKDRYKLSKNEDEEFLTYNHKTKEIEMKRRQCL